MCGICRGLKVGKEGKESLIRHDDGAGSVRMGLQTVVSTPVSWSMKQNKNVRPKKNRKTPNNNRWGIASEGRPRFSLWATNTEIFSFE